MTWAINWSSLYFSSRLLLVLSILAVALYAGLMALLNVVALLCERHAADSSIAHWLNRKHATPRLRRQVQEWVPRLTLLIVGYILGNAEIFNPVRELHNVEVMSVDAPRVITVQAQGKQQTWRICKDGDDLPLRAGMVMTVVQFEQHYDCILFNRNTVVTYLRDANKNVVDKYGHQLFEGEN